MPKARHRWVDGFGNRVAAQVYGPRNVFLFASEKKIVPDVNAAIKRIQTVAAPLNARRLGIDTPCSRGEGCDKCNPDVSICNFTVIMHRQRVKGRVTLFLMKEDFGF